MTEHEYAADRGEQRPPAAVAPDGGRDPGKVAIVIPCYRVARHIGDVIGSIPARYDVIVCVDDCSSDDTA